VLKGKTQEVYRLIIKSNQPIGVREIQRNLKFSSPSLVHYHLEKLKNEGLVKEEVGGYVADRIMLLNMVRFGGALVPRFFFYFLFFTLGAVLEVTLLMPHIVTREYFIAVLFTCAAAIGFGFETLQQRRNK
jgi:DNA-binding transcriptional ArsR family regulator